MGVADESGGKENMKKMFRFEKHSDAGSVCSRDLNMNCLSINDTNEFHSKVLYATIITYGT